MFFGSVSIVWDGDGLKMIKDENHENELIMQYA